MSLFTLLWRTTSCLPKRSCRSTTLCCFHSISAARTFPPTSSVSGASFSSSSGPRRRKRVPPSRYEAPPPVSLGMDSGGLTTPFAPAEDDISDYLEKASLSPWVPVPDSVARRMLELAEAGSDDVHVDLGSGDGRVNFHAIDPPFSVKRSIGFDIDGKLVKISQDRLSRRHPLPDLTFEVADLLSDDSQDIWDTIGDADVITMYFVQDALKRILPKLESALKGKKCRLVTCGYAMPTWDPHFVEVMLGLPIHVYNWGSLAPHNNQVYQLTEEEERIAMAERPRIVKSEDDFSPMSGQYDDAEKIEIPFIDESEKIDFHWDDFDDEEEESEYENPAIEKWRKPE